MGNLLLPASAGDLDKRNDERKRDWSARTTTRAGHRRCPAAGEMATATFLICHKIKRHRTVSIAKGAHEDASWRFSVGVAAQAAPSNPAVSCTRPSHQDDYAITSQQFLKNKKHRTVNGTAHGTAFCNKTIKKKGCSSSQYGNLQGPVPP